MTTNSTKFTCNNITITITIINLQQKQKKITEKNSIEWLTEILC